MITKKDIFPQLSQSLIYPQPHDFNEVVLVNGLRSV